MEKLVTVLNEEGLHARPAAILVKEANAYTSDVSVMVNGSEVNAKSIMGLMALGLTKNTELTLKATGADEAEAVEALSKLFENKFNLN
ncbi:MAG: HPr family phosphocarrier protein [Bacteriovoracaceae bacterium]|nr:HPr family phosphocarrier protein [Bacteriovoracaceae bacterium]